MILGSINYFRVYKLRSDCSNSETYTSGDLNSLHDHSVKSTITAGVNGNTTTVYVNNGASVSFRAVEEITLLDGFEVDIEGEFYAENTSWCP